MQRPTRPASLSLSSLAARRGDDTEPSSSSTLQDSPRRATISVGGVLNDSSNLYRTADRTDKTYGSRVFSSAAHAQPVHHVQAGGERRPDLKLVMPSDTLASRSSSAAASFNTHSRVGLGLMLEPDSSNTPDLVQHDINSTPSTSGLSSARSSLDSTDSGPARARSSAPASTRWGLFAKNESGDDENADTTLTLSPTGPVDSFLRTRSPGALSSATCAAAGSPTIASRRGADTRLSAHVGVTSPLLVPASSTPQPNTALSPRLTAPSPVTRSPSPSHGAYNLSGARPVSATTTTPTRPTSIIGSIVGSVSMDRQSSASKSRDVHNRHQSLTSACPPVTSSFNNSPAPGSSPPEKSSSGTASFRMKRSGSSGNSPKRTEAAWLWSRGRESAPGSARNSDDDEDPREGAKAYMSGPPPSKLDSLLSLPSNLLALFLAPLTNHGAPPTVYATSPALGGSPAFGGPNSAVAKSPKRYPLALRIVVLSYLVFSVFSFALHLHSVVNGKTDPRLAGRSKADVAATSRIEPRATSQSSQQHVIAEATEEVNADTTFPLGSMRRVRLGHWAHKVAEGVRWGRGSVQAEEDAALELLRKEVEGDNLDEPAEGMAEWGIVRRMSGAQGE
ncbi:hypothetical protein OIV83_003389 [Microbotryomycetes sp. JL201]|nr:hypothetical protein OIV83_003389 [Microbotryomycetes sp. JL201]